MHVDEILRLADTNKRRLGAMEDFDLRNIDFPKVAHYGHEHAMMTSQLAFTIGQSLRLTERELRVVRLAGFFHDLGREVPWTHVDPECPGRSAVLAETALRIRTDMDREVIAETCRLVEQHHLGYTGPDPRARALHDADALEECRYAPGQPDCMRRFKNAVNVLTTKFAQDKVVQKHWLQGRGWRSA